MTIFYSIALTCNNWDKNHLIVGLARQDAIGTCVRSGKEMLAIGLRFLPIANASYSRCGCRASPAGPIKNKYEKF